MMSAPDNLRIAFEYPLPEAELPALREALADHQLLLYGERLAEPAIKEAPAFRLEDADVIYGQPDPELLRAAPNLRWVELSSAGYTDYDNEALRENFRQRGVTLTNSSHVYDEPCAQHLAAMILALARNLPGCLENQRASRGWPDWPERSRSTSLLNEQTALIYGFGAIARRLVEILAPLRMRLIGVRRQPRGDEGIPMLDEQAADAMLGEADHVINILPASPATHRFFDAARFARFKPGARFYNIGRGATVDQDALAAALDEGARLDAAYLDVTDPEPLPPAHPLWRTPRCYITPHFGGGHAGETKRLVAHFLANLVAFKAGGELSDRIY